MNAVEYDLHMGKFIRALDEGDEEEAMRLLKAEGFLTPANLFQWSKEVLRTRRKTNGVDLWKVADAVIDHVGEEPVMWNPLPPPRQHGMPTASDMWLGHATLFCVGFYQPTSDEVTTALFFHRLSPACFSLAGLLSSQGMSEPPLRCTDAVWDDMATKTGALFKRPDHPRGPAKLILRTILDDYPTLLARVEGEGVYFALSSLQATLCQMCTKSVLHMNSPRSIASCLFVVNPSAFLPALKDDPTLLDNHRMLGDARKLLDVMKNTTMHSTSYEAPYEALMRAVDHPSLEKLVHLVDEQDHELLADNVAHDNGRDIWSGRVERLRALYADSRR